MTTTLPRAMTATSHHISVTGDSVMPEDLRWAAVLRLLALLKIMLVVHLVGVMLNSFGSELLGWSAGCAVLGAVEHSLGLLMTIAFIVVIKRGKVQAEKLLNWGLAYQVITCFVAAFAEQAQAPSGISVVAVLILIFPLFVPRDVGKTLLAGLLSACVAPLAVLLFHSQSGQTLSSDVYVQLAANFAFAGFAVVPSKVMAHLARQVKDARRMGAYELTSKLGAGGMGEVWRAKHRLLRRPAAIKLIRQEALGGGDAALAISRFEREAQATAGLESPHTVELYDFGVAQGNTLYYVMELLNGLDLESVVSQFGPLPPERVLFILRQVLDSLDDAHTRGLVHRDIKPANILICRKGRQHDFVKVVDFGLVRINADMQQTSSITQTGEGKILGTPAYLAPESVTGAGPLDGRSDLYSLGCVAYYLLSGQNVFEAQSAMAMAVAHATQAPPPLSEKAEQAIPPALEQLVMQCLEKDPDARPKDAYALSEALAKLALTATWTNADAMHWWNTHLSDHSQVTRAASEAPTAIVEPLLSA